MLLVSGEGSVLAANRAAAEELGLPREALAGRPLAELVDDPPSEIARYLKDCSRNRQFVLGSLSFTGNGGRQIECRTEGAVLWPRLEGAPAIVLLRFRPREKTVQQFLLLNEQIEELHREITRRKRTEEELRHLEQELKERAERLAEADRRKNEFLAMLAHELRNPLAPIRNALHLLGRPGTDAATVQRVREIMEHQIEHMVRLVDDLLEVSRITRGKIQLRKERIDVKDLAVRVAEASRPLMDAHGHSFSVSVPPEPVWLEADPVRLEQVLVNLLNNAAKFTGAGGRIWLSLAAEEDEAVLRVRDTGAGIPPDLLPIVFEPFVQANGALDRAQGGLGIGLTLVRSLVEMHGGRVSAHSEGLGTGTEIAVRLPRLPAMSEEGPEEGAEERSEDSARPQEKAPAAPRRVLVVDDNRDSAESIAMLAELWGHQTRIVYDGPAALAEAQAWQPDVVLLDIGLPGINGYEVARRLRQMPSLDGVLLAAMTGYGQERDRRLSREAGFDVHLVKPVPPETLQELLARGS
jgi:two-component system CheB/CheR fusion protein